MRFFERYTKHENAKLLRAIIEQKKIHYFHYDEEPNKLYISLSALPDFIAVIDVARQKAHFRGQDFPFNFDTKQWRERAQKIAYQVPAASCER